MIFIQRSEILGNYAGYRKTVVSILSQFCLRGALQTNPRQGLKTYTAVASLAWFRETIRFGWNWRAQCEPGYNVLSIKERTWSLAWRRLPLRRPVSCAAATGQGASPSETWRNCWASIWCCSALRSIPHRPAPANQASHRLIWSHLRHEGPRHRRTARFRFEA